MSHPELKAEQAYVDRAYACVERMREVVLRAGDAADGEVAQAALDAWAAKRLATFEDAERGLLFGRLDFEAVERALYIGRRWVHDEEGEQVVVNWQAPAARPFYTATPQDPQRVTLRRRFRVQGRKLLDIADETLDGSTLDGASLGDFLLEELERSRDSHMRDIVATIQADQYRLITRPPDRPLVIQGGPGTGKTAVGLHRASWLIYTERERNARSRVLVVDPPLVGDPPRTYDHVIVDEAQDLSPMQLRMIGRRTRHGALTILGDVAQGTGTVTYESWDNVLPYLPDGNRAEVEELRHAYRVPREIMELALPLLDTIAPGIERPLAYRAGASEPLLRQVPEGALLREAYHEAARLAREDGLVALIVPDELLEPALAHESAFDSVPLLTPREVKGLEFDHVIVVEPALITEHEQGLRELYVALTRPTTTLVVVYSRPLPAELGL